MKRYIFIVILILLTILPLVHASDVSIVAKSLSQYAKWMPTDGNKLTFLVHVSKPKSKGSIAFSWAQVSSWPGTYMNKGNETTPDLCFDATQSKSAWADVSHARRNEPLPAGLPPPKPVGSTRNPYNPEHVTWTVSDDCSTASFSWVSRAYLPPEGFTIQVTVQSKDGGSFGILQATYNGTATINVPKDDNGDYIADYWRKDAWVDGMHSPPADDEKGPTGQPNTVENNTQIGDGLTRFEEYRGGEINGEHTRFDPQKKDIFIFTDGLGIGDASNLPRNVFAIREIAKDDVQDSRETRNPITKKLESINDRTVNFNSLGTPTDFGAGEDSPWRVMAKEAIWIDDNTTANAPYSGVYENGILTIYTAYIRSDVSTFMSYSGRLGCPWTSTEDAIIKEIAQTLGHEIGHAIGLEHPWESRVGVNEDGHLLGSVPKPTATEQAEKYSDLDFDPNQADDTDDTDDTDDIVINDHAKGWLGLYAFDNSNPTNAAGYDIVKKEIERRVEIFKGWQDEENNAQIEYNKIVRQFNEGTLRVPLEKAEKMAEKARSDYRKKLVYKKAEQKRNLYWVKAGKRTLLNGKKIDTYRLRLHTRNANGAEFPVGAGPFTYSYGNSIMDYNFRRWDVDGSTNILYGIYTVSTYPNFHNWEYDLGVPADRAAPVWIPRPNPVPVPCGGTPVNDQGTNDQGTNDQNTNDQNTNTAQPDAPTGLSMTPGNGQIRLSWSTVSGTVTDYQYRYSENGGSWSSWKSAGLVTRFFVLDLTNGSTYVFEVRAMNGQIEGVATTTSLGVTPATVPGVSTISRIDSGDRQVNINWTKPSDNGGAAITDYKYQYRESNGGTWRTLASFGFTNLSETTILSEDIAGLTNGTEYEFQVCAVNRVGNGALSSSMTATPRAPAPPPVPPTAPTDLSGTSGDGEVTLSWTEPSSSGSSEIEYYEYRYATGHYPNHSTWTDWTSTRNISTSYIVTELTNDTQHLLQVRAVNYNNLRSPASNTAFATPRAPDTVPSAPSGLRFVIHNGYSRLTWTAPSSNGGSSITDYEYRYRENNTGSWGSWESAGDTSIGENIPDLTSGTFYGFQVRAVNINGESEPSNTATGTTPSSPTVPSAPSGLRFVIYNGNSRLTWTAPSSNGGSSITDYEYRYRENNTGSWGSWESAGDISTGENIPDLTSGTFYGFQVRAVNINGESEPSNTATGTAR